MNYLGEGLAEPGRLKVALEMFSDQPRLEGREEQRGGNAAENAPEHQHLKVGFWCTGELHIGG